MTTPEQPPRPRGVTGPLQALRENLANQIKTGTGKLPQLDDLGQKAQAALAQTRADVEASAFGLVAAGVLRGARGTEAPPITGTIDPAEVDFALLEGGPAFSRQAVEEALAARQEAEAAESRKRMAFIVKYVKDPSAHELFADKTVVYHVFAEERTYQVQLLARHRQALARLGPDARAMGLSEAEIAADPQLAAQEQQRAALTRQIAHTTAVRTQLLTIMARLTGVAIDEAALAFEPEPERPATTEETSTADALDAAAALLRKMKKG